MGILLSISGVLYVRLEWRVAVKKQDEGVYLIRSVIAIQSFPSDFEKIVKSMEPQIDQDATYEFVFFVYFSCAFPQLLGFGRVLCRFYVSSFSHRF